MICFIQKVTFGLALEKDFSVPFLEKSSVLLGPSLCAMDTIPLVSTSKTLIHARCLQI